MYVRAAGRIAPASRVDVRFICKSDRLAVECLTPASYVSHAIQTIYSIINNLFYYDISRR